MLRRYDLYLPVMFLCLSMSAVGDITMTNGADLDMNGSTGSTVIFPDGTVLSTASGSGADGAPGADGADGSDAAVPTGHGGTGNTVTGTDSFVGGGANNQASGDYSTVGGGQNNDAQAQYSTISGGGPSDLGNPTTTNNRVTDDYGTIGGGGNNQAGNDAGTTDDRTYATVGGGAGNNATGSRSTVGGGDSNVASNSYATVGGGWGNDASGDSSTVGGGESNNASGWVSTVGGGWINEASGDYSTVGGGAGNEASGYISTVPGGFGNTAAGACSFAAGKSANDGGHNNVFIWGDNGGGTATASNQFNVHASGGIYLNGGVHAASDRNLKEGFAAVSAPEVLEKVLKMPVSTWRFKSEEDTVRHIGPMAQDFKAAFGYGGSDTHITSTDADGVALVAIQGLNQKLEEKQAEIDSLKKEFTERFASLEQRLLAMETPMN